jgi:hypothetical protein
VLIDLPVLIATDSIRQIFIPINDPDSELRNWAKAIRNHSATKSETASTCFLGMSSTAFRSSVSTAKSSLRRVSLAVNRTPDRLLLEKDSQR